MIPCVERGVTIMAGKFSSGDSVCFLWGIGGLGAGWGGSLVWRWGFSLCCTILSLWVMMLSLCVCSSFFVTVTGWLNSTKDCLLDFLLFLTTTLFPFFFLITTFPILLPILVFAFLLLAILSSSRSTSYTSYRLVWIVRNKYYRGRREFFSVSPVVLWSLSWFLTIDTLFKYLLWIPRPRGLPNINQTKYWQ